MADPFRDVDAAAERDPQIAFWEAEIVLALKRESAWRKSAERVLGIYEGEKKAENSFNILFSNTETLLPSVYNQLPRPIVERRFKDADPLAKASSTALERVLSYLMDSPDAEYDPFSSLVEQAVLGALVPGRGVTRFRYDPTFEDSSPALGDEGEAEGDDGEETGEGEPAGESRPVLAPEATRRVAYETVCGSDVDFDSFLMGYARRWVDTPWIAFIHEMSREDLEANFGPQIASRVPISLPAKRDADGERQKDDYEESKNRGSVKTAEVHEIWHKASKKIIFYCREYKEALLKVVDDPLRLSGFYPCPEPLVFVLKRSTQTPTPLYILYEEQAKELNRLTQRINRVLNATKVRGFYDGSLQGLKDLLSSEDNTLLPAKNVAALQDGKTLQNSIWLMPIGELVQVLQQLFAGRQECKQTIYEITGLADIMRGQGQASETATAQQIKNQWGTLRMKRLQRYTQRYVRACLRIMGELAGRQFAVETFAGMTNLDYATPEAVMQAQKTMQVVQQAQLLQPPQGAPGSSPAGPPPLPPQMQQAMQQAQATLSKPPWEQVVGLLRDDLQRNYRIDIETNSTIDATSQEDKQNITEAMTAISNTMQTFEPALMQGLFPMPAFKSMMLSVARRFEFGRQVEEDLGQIPDQPPPPPQDPKADAAAMQQKQQLAEKEMDLAGREQQLAMAQEQMKQQQQMADQMAKAKLEIAQAKQQIETLKTSGETEMAFEQLLSKIESLLGQHELSVQKLLLSNQPKPVPDTSKKAGAEAGAAAAQKQAQASTEAQNKKQFEVITKAIEGSNKALADAIAELTAATLAPRKISMTRGEGNPPGPTVQ